MIAALMEETVFSGIDETAFIKIDTIERRTGFP